MLWLALALLTAALTISLLRARHLHPIYSMCWFLLAFILFLFAIFPQLPDAWRWGMILLCLALRLLLGDVAQSRFRGQLRALAQHQAELELRQARFAESPEGKKLQE